MERTYVVYTDSDLNDVGVLKKFYIDHEVNEKAENNTFELTVKPGKNPGLGVGSCIYVEGTELGGMLREIKAGTTSKTITYIGKTWRGLLADHIVCPPDGKDYFTDKSTASGIVANLISNIGLDSFFIKGEVTGGSYSVQYDRYCDAFTGLHDFLSANGLKLVLKYSGGNVYYTVIPIAEYTDFSGELFDFEIDHKIACNHMIGLGKGNLKDRQRVDYYIGANGEVTTEQYYTGVNEITKVYELSNAASLDVLKDKTKKALIANAVEDGLKTTAHDNLDADLGDKFTATLWIKTDSEDESITITQVVTKKITYIKNGRLTNKYEVGSLSTSDSIQLSNTSGGSTTTTGLVKVKKYWSSVTVPAGAFISKGLGTLEDIDGYTFIGFTAEKTGYGDQFTCSFGQYGTSVYATVHNKNTSSLTANISCYAVYMSESLVDVV